MNACPLRRILIALMLLVSGRAVAQAPDCSGVPITPATIPEYVGELTTVLLTSGFSQPVHVAHAPGDTERLFVVEQEGRIRIVQGGAILPTDFLDLRSSSGGPVLFGGEQGLLSVAFHPDYFANGDPNEGNFFVYFTNTNGNIEVSRYTVTADANVADPASRVTVIEVPHPGFSNHNGGQVAFSPNDGHLYLGTGDGGGGCDPGPGIGNAQNLDSLLGKMLRLNVDSLPYTTTGNPFDGPTPGADEIWAYGLRNPYTFSFDRMSGAQYIADVGQNAIEEISCATSTSTGGENFGWVEYEGTACPNPSCGGGCTITNHVPPIEQYSPTGARSVIGGSVYRGCLMPDLHGTYFYTDFYDGGRLSTFTTFPSCKGPLTGTSVTRNRSADLDPPGALAISNVGSFGEDARGEILLTDFNGGEIFRVVPTLSIMEVSGNNAAPLLFEASDVTWSDLGGITGHPIFRYKVYRSDGDPTGPFLCVAAPADAVWVGGDPEDPLGGEVFYYLVTALNSTNEETVPGRGSSVPRVVDTTSVCP